MSLSTEYIVSSLQDLYGDTVKTGDIRAWCAMNGCSYPTVTKKISEYKSGRGKWELTVQDIKEELEETYTAPAVENHIEQDLVPCLLYTSPSPRDATLSRMPSSA